VVEIYDVTMDISGRHVVVTGAAGGIGAALARRFHAAGARLVLADRVSPDAVAAGLPGSVAVAADLGTEDGNIALIRSAEEAFGPIDLFFANAGVALGTDPMDDEEMWDLSFAINTHAHRWAARHLLPGWLERGEGYFCSTASAAGLLAQIGSAPYSLSKHAAVAFAEWLAITYGARGLKVSCLCPQGVNTAMLAQSSTIGDGGEVVRSVGVVLEPDDVAEIVHQAIVDERFLILPHPEVADYLKFKATEPEKWIAGMQRLQRRVMGV
jgi:NAD(P)-dependent dehydrogenase (short-subunit alcohol dehydrogenase family)